MGQAPVGQAAEQRVPGSRPERLPPQGVPFLSTWQVVDARWLWQPRPHACLPHACSQDSGRLDKHQRGQEEKVKGTRQGI